MDDEAILDTLAGIDLFQGLAGYEMKRLITSGIRETWAHGDHVVDEGGGARGFYLVLDGTASVQKHGAPVRKLVPGDYFGEISLIDQGTRSVSIEAGHGLETLQIPRGAFLLLIDAYPSFVRSLLIALCGRIRTLEAERDAASLS